MSEWVSLSVISRLLLLGNNNDVSISLITLKSLAKSRCTLNRMTGVVESPSHGQPDSARPPVPSIVVFSIVD